MQSIQLQARASISDFATSQHLRRSSLKDLGLGSILATGSYSTVISDGVPLMRCRSPLRRTR